MNSTNNSSKKRNTLSYRNAGYAFIVSAILFALLSGFSSQLMYLFFAIGYTLIASYFFYLHRSKSIKNSGDPKNSIKK